MRFKRALFFCLIFSVVPAIWAQQKFALVIGNANYTGISRLNNPVNDAINFMPTNKCVHRKVESERTMRQSIGLTFRQPYTYYL